MLEGWKGWKGSVIACAVAVGCSWASPSARAACEVISATHSAESKAAAAAAAHQLALRSAAELRRQRGWRTYSMRARKVTPDPFWKAVRPVVPPEIILKPDVVTAQTYAICWPGVVVPYVCTAGSLVCGR